VGRDLAAPHGANDFRRRPRDRSGSMGATLLNESSEAATQRTIVPTSTTARNWARRPTASTRSPSAA
jgi:hypothetical protein